MDTRESKAVDALLMELEQVREKSRMIDEWFFKLLSIIVIPFFVLLAFAYANSPYRMAFLAVPFIGIIGIFVNSIFINHYMYCERYGAYLQKRINQLLKKKEIRRQCFADVFYNTKSSFSILAYVLVMLMFVALMIFLVPIVNLQRSIVLTQQTNLPPMLLFSLRNYWLIAGVLFVVVVLLTAIGHLTTSHRAMSLTTHGEEPEPPADE